MNLGRTFTTRESPDRARQLAGDYLEKVGYKPSGSTPAFVYRRGSKLGSVMGLSTKSWHVTATLQLVAGQDELTHATVSFDIDTTGQYVIKRERTFWDRELDGLVAAARGMNADVSPLAKAEEKVRLETRFKSGANWFYWIAGMSLLNSLMVALHLRFLFFIGLGATQFVDGVAAGLASYRFPEFATLLRVAALVMDALLAGLFAVFGLLANKGHRWSFVVGAVLYALDALIFLIVPDFLSIGFHIFALVGILAGLRAAKKVGEVEQQPPGPAA